MFVFLVLDQIGIMFRSGTQLSSSIPLMVDATHEQGTIEFNRSWWEPGRILEKAGFHLVYRQWLHLPIETVKFQPIELAWLRSD